MNCGLVRALPYVWGGRERGRSRLLGREAALASAFFSILVDESLFAATQVLGCCTGNKERECRREQAGGAQFKNRPDAARLLNARATHMLGISK